jgi:hypothetical protein
VAFIAFFPLILSGHVVLISMWAIHAGPETYGE